ncbi:GNAT family N-acetyltransferase [Nitratireductor pacificus]|uniref:N-acetyltransferase GCN5 n=1 Tax=Nitratireductor pacificus pht-3B TaxID=391937 RepID=K2MN54_9HYPH|nr:GNAT family N-acetyltransferase [Nitratireductor pacificus]EKF18677.1 N-acetyltransferase GCN5 [Nitratireductor pacificus pht-3B]
MSAISHRPATRADIAAIARIYAHAVTHGTASYELDPPDEAEMLSRMQALTGSGYPYLVAIEGDTILGYAYAGPFRPRWAYRFVVEDSVYVAPQAQGRGVGRLLLAGLIEDCARLGFRQILAVIGDGSRHKASVGLHAALGFRHAGVLQGSGFKHGAWLDTVFMQLTLNGGTDSPPDPDSLPERLFRGGAGS